MPLAAVGISLFALGFAPLLSVLSPAPGLAPLAAAYVHTRAFGVAGITAAMVLSAFFRGFGNTRVPLYAMVVANLVNVVLNYGLIFGHFGLPAWGVAGSGAATAIAEWIYAAVLLVAFRRARRRSALRDRAGRSRSGGDRVASCAPARRSAASGCSTCSPSPAFPPWSRAWGRRRWRPARR